ncbi:MAG TPA: helicase, partial [Gallicola sp.]|nr:helicase [Gallicola sp.]
AIKDGLAYPPSDNGEINYNDLLEFLETLSEIFNWDYYEKKTLGKRNYQGEHAALRWYAVILNQWMTGYGFNNIISSAIRYKQSKPDATIERYGQFIPYNDSLEHKNIVIADVLDTIDNIILFSISNYFLRFSTEYKLVHNIEDNFDNDWYEYVEYGTTNRLTIFLQRNGFTRETSSYIKQNKTRYVIETEESIKLKREILECPKESVRLEVENILYNLPDLFE